MFFPIAMNGACDIHFFLKKEDQIAYFHEKKKKCLPLFVEVDILGLSEIFCFVLHSCSIMIDQKNQYYTIIMNYFIVWVVVCVIPACCFFLDEFLNEETSRGIFGKKKSEWIDCFCFFINILLVCCVSVVSWIGKIADLFIVHVFLSFLNWFIRIAQVYWETNFNGFFFQINEFFYESTKFQDEQSKPLLNEYTLWTIFQIVENWLSFIHSWVLDTIDLQKPDWICGSALSTFQFTRGVEYLLLQANRSWIRSWTLHVNRLVFDSVDRFLSSQTGHLTIQSQYNFWKPPHPFDWSLSLFVVNLFTVLESEEAFTQSLVESLNDSLISMNVHISSSYPNIMLCHLSCDFTHEFTRRINLKNLWPSQWSMLINCLKSSTDLRRNIWGERFDSLESACNINNCQCIFIYRISFLAEVCHEEGKEDQLYLLDLGIAHQKLVLAYV